MPYGIDTEPFRLLDVRLQELPDELPQDPSRLEGVLYAYLNAFACLLSLVMAIMRVCAEREQHRRYVVHFLPVYDRAAQRIIEILQSELREGLQERSVSLVEFIYAIRDGQVGPELIALEQALSEDEGTGSPEDHLETATTVTNSLKEQIAKHTKRKWIDSVLHVLNEVISIVRGVV